MPPVPDWVPTVEGLADSKAGPEFAECDIERIIGSLPASTDPRQVELLRTLLCNWAQGLLRRRLSQTPLPTLRQQRERLQKVAKKAAHLLQALDQLEGHDRWQLVEQLGIAEGQSLLEAVYNRSNKRRLDEWRSLTATVSAAAAKPLYKPGRGQPRKNIPQRVLQDLAALFEYTTGLPATRRVDRISGKETGPFLDFAQAVWPVIFGSTSGLLSQLREWAENGRRKSSLS